MKLLDFSKMKKVSMDDKTTTFKHEDGHEVRILHNALSKIHKEQIKRLPIHEPSLGLADGGEVEEDVTPESGPMEESSVDSVDRAPSHDTHITINAAPAAPAAVQEAGPVKEANPIDVPAVIPPVSVAPQDKPLPGSAANPINAAHIPSQALGTAVQAANEKANVEAAKAQGMEPIYEQQGKNAQATTDRINKTISDMSQHVQDFAQYITEKPINSRRLLQDQTDEQKMQTGVGLFLGGLGGGGRSNLAMDYLNKAIDRDVDAQKANMEQKKTIFGAYQHLYEDENVSTNLAKVSLGDKIIADANVLAAKLGTPEAKANRDALVSQIQQQQYEQLQKAAFIANEPRKNATTPTGGAPGQGSGAPSGKTSGAPTSKIKYGPEGADASGIYHIRPILLPGAAAKNDYLGRTSDPAIVSQLPRIQEQYARAQKADEVISRAYDVYSQMRKNVTPGGWTGRHAGAGIGAAAAAVPVVGAPIAALAGAGAGFLGDIVTGARTLYHKIPGTDQSSGDEFSKERQYETARQELGDLLRSVYPGISGGEYDAKLNAVVPDFQDKPGDITRKMKAFEDLVKTSGEFNLLKNRGMAR